MRFRIHVSGSVLARNAATGQDEPAIIVAMKDADMTAPRWIVPSVGVGYVMAKAVELRGRCQIMQRDGRIWIEGDTLQGDAAVILEGRPGLDPDQPAPPEDW